MSHLKDALEKNISISEIEIRSFIEPVSQELINRIYQLTSPEVVYHEKRALIPWSESNHKLLAQWNFYIDPIVETVYSLAGENLPIEIWREILGFLNCGDFGPLALTLPE